MGISPLFCCCSNIRNIFSIHPNPRIRKAYDVETTTEINTCTFTTVWSYDVETTTEITTCMFTTVCPNALASISRPL